MRYAILKNTTYDPINFGLADIVRMNEVDPGQISTFSGDLAAFRARGGKLISYHGRMDEVRLQSSFLL